MKAQNKLLEAKNKWLEMENEVLKKLKEIKRGTVLTLACQGQVIKREHKWLCK